MSISTFRLNYDNGLLLLDFGDQPATNAQILRDLPILFDRLRIPGGALLKISGRVSVPLAFYIASRVNNIFGAVAIWDPKLDKFVVSVSRSPDYQLGDLYLVSKAKYPIWLGWLLKLSTSL